MSWYDQGYERAEEINELGVARTRAHEAFDPIWKSVRTGRGRARGICYRWLTFCLGFDEQAHMGQMDVKTCERVVEICRGTTWPQVLAWWNRQRVESGSTKEN